jgi:hypothetical protein
MSLAFHAGSLIDHVGDAIAFADGLGGALRYARATGDAVFGNFHGHSRYSFKMYYYAHKINRCQGLRQLTNFFYLVKFVTILHLPGLCNNRIYKIRAERFTM